MTWFFLSLGCALATASNAVVSKILLRKNNQFWILYLTYAFSMPMLLFGLFLYGIPHLSFDFWRIVIIMLPIEVLAVYSFISAIKLSPLSLVFPFLGFTPVFSLFTASLLLKEQVPPAGITGIILVTVGAYLLNIRTIKEGLFAPIRHIYKEKGSMIMLLVAFLFSFTAVLGKKAVLLSDPVSFPAIYYSGLVVILTPLAIVRLARHDSGISRKSIFLFFLGGILFSFSVLMHFKAIALARVSYMISVKRLSLVISVFYGAVIFKEKNIGYRLFGSSVMLAGVLIMILAQ